MNIKEKILFIIPAYNEEECILKTCNTIFEYNKKNKTNYDVLVVNDASLDNTEKILRENNINHIQLVHNLGIGGAVQTGYKYAYKNGYDIAIQYDGDGQHDVNYAINLIEAIREKKANLVVGSRFIDKSSSEFQSSFARRIGIMLISWTIELKTKFKLYDTTSGFRACDKKVIELFASNYPVEYPEPISTVNALLNNCKVFEVPVSMNERNTGTSSISSWKKAYYMINVGLSILAMKKVKK